jgi:GYF domain 2
MKKYFLHDGTTQHGPFDLEELQTKIITAQTLIWFEPMTDWKPAGEIEELKYLINNKVPAQQTAMPPIVEPKEEDWSKKQYFYTDSSGQQGPFTLDQLKSKPITSDTPVWYDPLPEWTTAGKVVGLKNIISTTTIDAKPVEQKEDIQHKKQYYYSDNGKQYGPFSLEQLIGKPITLNTAVWHDPLLQWTTAGQVVELKDFINASDAAVKVIDEDWSRKQYYYTDSTGQQGPFTLEQLKTKPIKSSTPVWYDPLPKWTTAGKVAGLKDIINNVVAAPGVMEEDWGMKQYFYSDNTGQQGPFTLDQLRGRPITSNTPVWYEPLLQWTTAGKVAGLRDIINNTSAIPKVIEEDWSKKQFFYIDNTGQHGPFSLEQLMGKGITSNTPVWYDPLPQWTTAGKVAGLRSIIS